jgi:sugar phosphate permease
LLAVPSMRGRVMGLWTMALPGTEPATSPFAGFISQTFGARDGFSLSGVALLLTAVIGWRALNDRPASAGEGAAGEAAAKAGPAETTAPTATAALAETAVLAEPPFADTAGP